MKRTQIYLSDELDAELTRRSEATGVTKSQLIREAIQKVYLRAQDTERAVVALEASAGSWSDEQTGGDYVERLRSGRLAELYAADGEA